jgi:hypothetical protein
VTLALANAPAAPAHDTERGNLPSASDFPRLHLCPGSLNMVRAMRKAGIPTNRESKDSEEGEFMHNVAMGLLPCEGLSDEQETALATAEHWKQMALEAAGLIEVELVHEQEQRLWVNAPYGPYPIYSGRFDELWYSTRKDDPDFNFAILGGPALLLDYKFGRLLVSPAHANYQLMAYAVGAWQRWRFETIYVAIVQPRVGKDEQFTMARYTARDLPHAYRRCVDLLDAAEEPDAPRNPSEDACRYCPAQYFCPEAKAHFRDFPVQLPTKMNHE